MRWQPYYTDREAELDRRVHAFGLLLALISNTTPAPSRGREQTIRAGAALRNLCFVAAWHAGKIDAVSPGAAAAVQLSLVPPVPRPSAIFLLIAGSYKPFTVAQMHGQWTIGLTVAAWVGALAGAAYKLAFPIDLQPAGVA